MGIHIILYIYLIFFSSLGWTSEHYFSGKTLPKANMPFDITSADGNTEINAKNMSLYILPHSKAKALPEYKEGLTYFSIINPDDPTYKGKFFSAATSNLDFMIISGGFGNWLKNTFETGSKEVAPTTQEATMEYDTEYRITSEAQIELIGVPKTSLTKGTKFHFSESPYGASVFVHKNNGEIREYFLKEGQAAPLNKLFQNNQVLRIGEFSPKEPEFESDLTSAKTENSPENESAPERSPEDDNFNSPPTLAITAEIAKDSPGNIEQTLSPKVGECGGDLSDNDLYETCNENNDHYEKTIADVLKPTDSYNKDPLKYCILAGLKSTGSTMKLTKCIDGKKQDGKYPVCRSKGYIDLVYKELSQQADCFKNVKTEEIIPLINVESRFNINAYNNNPGTTQLNASGLLQSTHDVYRSVKPIVNLSSKFRLYNNTNNYCNSLLNGVKKGLYEGTSDEKESALNSFKERNICKRVGSIDGIRNNLFLAMAQYSNGKVQANNVINRIEATYLPDLEIFDETERKKMQIDIARLMHNRGSRKIETMLEMFFYDLFRGGDPSTINKRKEVRNGKRGYEGLPHFELYPHGNPRLHSLWGRPEFNAPLNHESFSKYFSSYLFYEGSRIGIGNVLKHPSEEKYTRKAYKNKGPKSAKYIEPNRTLSDGNTDLEIEGGTYLYKIECDQKDLTLEAQKLAKKKDFTCDYPSSSEERLESIRIYTKWYDTCEDDNTNIQSRRKCASKSPHTAKESGIRRMSDETINKARKENRNLKKCDTNSLWGLAANPLTEFYSKEPETYK